MTSILQKRNNIIYPVNSLQPFNGISINVQNPFKFEYYGHYPGGQLVSIHSEIGSRLFDPDELFCSLHYENGKCIKQVCYYLERDTELNFFSKAKKNNSNIPSNANNITFGEDESNWHKSVQKATEVSFVDQVPDGKYTVWHRNGAIAFECFFHNKGVIQKGEYCEYDDEGDILKKVTHNGKNNEAQVEIIRTTLSEYFVKFIYIASISILIILFLVFAFV